MRPVVSRCDSHHKMALSPVRRVPDSGRTYYSPGRDRREPRESLLHRGALTTGDATENTPGVMHTDYCLMAARRTPSLFDHYPERKTAFASAPSASSAVAETCLSAHGPTLPHGSAAMLSRCAVDRRVDSATERLATEIRPPPDQFSPLPGWPNRAICCRGGHRPGLLITSRLLGRQCRRKMCHPEGVEIDLFASREWRVRSQTAPSVAAQS
jgi:hypothetical protein